MTAVGVAVFDALAAPGFLDQVNALGNRLSAGLTALSDKWGMRGERGQGLLRALMMDRDDGPALVAAARDRAPEGLLLNAPRGNLLRFMPALNVSADEIDTMLEWLDALLVQVRR
jgi:acetylornithine/N-succinyldiaminopimelate aminotransferase